MQPCSLMKSQSGKPCPSVCLGKRVFGSTWILDFFSLFSAFYGIPFLNKGPAVVANLSGSFLQTLANL